MTGGCTKARLIEDVGRDFTGSPAGTSELNWLRCQLRTVNIEYSALVRRKTSEAVRARMADLRTGRHVLIALIAGRRPKSMERPSGARPLTNTALGSA